MGSEKKPKSALDRALEALDSGAQVSPETGEGLGDPTRCARCLRAERAEGSEFCAGCRAFILEDSNEDPAADRRIEVVVNFEELVRADSDVVELVQSFVSASNDILVTSAAIVRLVSPEFFELANELELAIVIGLNRGLSEERCRAIIDEEVATFQTNLDGLDALPERVRQRLYHEAEEGSYSD